MHTDITSGANEVHSVCSTLSLPSSLHFIRMELIVLIGTHRRANFNTNSDGFGEDVDMTKGMNEVYSGYLVLSFIPCLGFTRIKLVVVFGIHRGGMFHTVSHGFEMHTDMTLGGVEVYLRCLALSLASSLDFVRMELVVLVGTHHGDSTPTWTDSKMHTDMTNNANEVHSGCFTLNFILCINIVQIELIMPSEPNQDFNSCLGTKFQTDLVSKCMPT